MKMTIELQPFITPNYVIAVSKEGLKQNGVVENPKWHINELDEETLSEMCDQFRHDIFTKACKVDPRKLEKQNEHTN